MKYVSVEIGEYDEYETMHATREEAVKAAIQAWEELGPRDKLKTTVRAEIVADNYGEELKDGFIMCDIEAVIWENGQYTGQGAD